MIRSIPIHSDASSIGHVADAASVGMGQQNHHGFRCSNKGFLPLSVADYILLLDWTTRQLADGKPGSTPHDAPPIFARLSIDPHVWCKLIGGFGRLFWYVAGRPQTIDVTLSRIG